nr:hypothetical protein [Candidatus Eremiobacteraeota bacterium]
EDPNLAGEFRMPSRRRYGFVVTGLSGALCTVVLFFAYVRLNSENTVSTMTVPPSFSIAVHTRRPIPVIAPRPHRHASIMHAAQPSVARRVSRQREFYGRSVAQSAASAGVKRTVRATRVLPMKRVRTEVHRLATVQNKHRAVRVWALSPVAQVVEKAVVQAQVVPQARAREDAYIVEQTAVEQPTSEASVTISQPPTGIPIKYCYARGTWRTC